MNKVIKVKLILLIIPFSFIMLYSCAFELPKEPVDDPIQEEPLISYEEIADIKYHEDYNYVFPSYGMESTSMYAQCDPHFRQSLERFIRFKNRDKQVIAINDFSSSYETVSHLEKDVIYQFVDEGDDYQSLLKRMDTNECIRTSSIFYNSNINSYCLGQYKLDYPNYTDNQDVTDESLDLYFEIFSKKDSVYYNYILLRVRFVPENQYLYRWFMDSTANVTTTIKIQVCNCIFFDYEENDIREISEEQFENFSSYMYQEAKKHRTEYENFESVDADKYATGIEEETSYKYFFVETKDICPYCIVYNKIYSSALCGYEDDKMYMPMGVCPIYPSTKVAFIKSFDYFLFNYEKMHNYRSYCDNDDISYLDQIRIYDAMYRKYYNTNAIKDASKMEYMEGVELSEQRFSRSWINNDDIIVLNASIWKFLNNDFSNEDYYNYKVLNEELYKETYKIKIYGQEIDCLRYYLHETYIYYKQTNTIYNIVEAFNEGLLDDLFMQNLLNQIEEMYYH